MNARMKPEPFNQSGLEPLGHAVLVKPYEPERKKSLIAMPETVSMRTMMSETRAIVMEIGPQAWTDEKQPRAAVGDKVLITRFAGAMLEGPADGKWYRAVNDRDLHTRITADRFGKVEGLDGEES